MIYLAYMVIMRYVLITYFPFRIENQNILKEKTHPSQSNEPARSRLC